MNEIDKKTYESLILTINNINDYNKNGYKVKFNIKIKTFVVSYLNSKKYYIRIIPYNNQLYWHLKPYNTTYYTTLYSNGLDMILFAIKENELLFI